MLSLVKCVTVGPGLTVKMLGPRLTVHQCQ